MFHKTLHSYFYSERITQTTITRRYCHVNPIEIVWTEGIQDYDSMLTLYSIGFLERCLIFYFRQYWQIPEKFK